MKVLVVDDNATSREILQRILESFSFNVTLAASGEEGLTELAHTSPENPFELVRIVRSFDPCLACSIHLVTPKGRDIARCRVA